MQIWPSSEDIRLCYLLLNKEHICARFRKKKEQIFAAELHDLSILQ